MQGEYGIRILILKQNFESESEFDFNEATSETGSAFETNSNPEADNESVSEFELNEATSETDSTWKLYDDYELTLPGSKIPKGWFNHQSVGSSISFSVGQKLPSFAFCVAPKVELEDNVPFEYRMISCSVYMYINGFKRCLAAIGFYLDSLSFMLFHHKRDRSLEDIILGDWNDIEIRFECSNYDPKIAEITMKGAESMYHAFVLLATPQQIRIHERIKLSFDERLKIFLCRVAAEVLPFEKKLVGCSKTQDAHCPLCE